MRDWISGLVSGLAAGGVQGAKLGLAARELRDDKEAKAAENLRRQLADQATAEYRGGMLSVAEKNAATNRGRAASTASYQGRMASTAEANAAATKTYREALIANGLEDNDIAVAAAAAKAGYDPGLLRAQGEPDPGPRGWLGMPEKNGRGGGGGGTYDPSADLGDSGDYGFGEGVDVNAGITEEEDPTRQQYGYARGGMVRPRGYANGGAIQQTSLPAQVTPPLNRGFNNGGGGYRNPNIGALGTLRRPMRGGTVGEHGMRPMQQPMQQPIRRPMAIQPQPLGPTPFMAQPATLPPRGPAPGDMTRVLPGRTSIMAADPNMYHTKPAPGAIQQFAAGGRVQQEDERRYRTTTPPVELPPTETTIMKSEPPAPAPTLGSPKTPQDKINTAKDQSRMGSQPTEALRGAKVDQETLNSARKAIKDGLEGLAAEAKSGASQAPEPPPELQQPSPGGAIGAPQPGGQEGRVQSQWKGTQPLTSEEDEAIGQQIDPNNRLAPALRELEKLAKGYDYFVAKGDTEKGTEYAKSFLQRSRLIAATFGMAGEQALQAGDFVKAEEIVTEAFNTHIPNGSTLLKDQNGLYVLRDAQGNIKAELDPTPENLAAAVKGLKDGSAWFEAMTYAAGEGMTAKDEAAAEGKDTGRGRNLDDRKQIAGQLTGVFEGAPTTESGEPVNLVKQQLASNLFDPNDLKLGEAPRPFQLEADPALGEAGTTATTEDQAKYDKLVKPVEQAVTDIATDLVIQSNGSLSPGNAAEIAAKLARVDYADPTREPFMVRQNKNPKTKKRDGGLTIRTADGETYDLPQSALPNLKKIVNFQMDMAKATATKLKAYKNEADELAKKDKLNREQFSSQNAAIAEAAGRLFGSTDRGAKATYLGKQPAGGRPQPEGPGIGDYLTPSLGKRPKSEPGDPVQTRPKGTTSVNRTRGGPKPPRVEQRTAKVSSGPTSRPRLDTSRPVPKRTSEGQPASARNLPNEAARATAALLRPGDNETKQAVRDVVSTVVKKLTPRLRQGAVGGRSSPPTRAQVEAAVKEVTKGPVSKSVIDEILLELNKSLKIMFPSLR